MFWDFLWLKLKDDGMGGGSFDRKPESIPIDGMKGTVTDWNGFICACVILF